MRRSGHTGADRASAVQSDRSPQPLGPKPIHRELRLLCHARGRAGAPILPDAPPRQPSQTASLSTWNMFPRVRNLVERISIRAEMIPSPSQKARPSRLGRGIHTRGSGASPCQGRGRTPPCPGRSQIRPAVDDSGTPPPCAPKIRPCRAPTFLYCAFHRSSGPKETRPGPTLFARAGKRDGDGPAGCLQAGHFGSAIFLLFCNAPVAGRPAAAGVQAPLGPAAVPASGAPACIPFTLSSDS